jgi:hypothetical protein
MTDQSMSRHERVMNMDLTPINNPNLVGLNNSNQDVSFNKGSIVAKAQSMGPKKMSNNIEEYFESKYIEAGKYLSPTSTNPKYNTTNMSQSYENSVHQGLIRSTLSPNHYNDTAKQIQQDNINIFQKLSEYKKGQLPGEAKNPGQVPNFFTKANTSNTKQNSSMGYERNIVAGAVNSNENTAKDFPQHQHLTNVSTTNDATAQGTPSNPNLQRKSATQRKSADGSKSFDLNRNKKYLNEIFSKRGVVDHDNSYSELYEKRKIYEIINENEVNDSTRQLSLSRERGKRPLLAREGSQGQTENTMRNFGDIDPSRGTLGAQVQTDYDKL